MDSVENENKRLIKNTFLLSIGGLTPKFIGLITLPIATRNLSTGEYGTYDIIVSVASILIPVLTLQIQQGAFRYLLTAKTDDKRKAYISSTIIFLFSTAILASVLGVGGMLIAHISPLTAICICLMMSAEAGYIVFGQLLRGMGQNIKYTISIIVYSVSYMLWMIILVSVLKFTLIGVLMSVMLGYATSLVYMACQKEIRHYFSHSYFSKESLKEMLAFSAPIVPSSISLWIINMSDRFVVTAFLGVSMNGIYSAATKIPTLYSTAYSIFNMAWTESAVRSFDTENPGEYYSKMFRFMFNFLIGVILLLLAATPLMFYVLFDAKYNDAYYQIPILYGGVFFSSLVSWYGSLYIALKETGHVAASSTAGAIINLAVNLLMVSRFGLYAASISTVVSYIIVCVYRYHDVGKMIKINYNYPEITIGLLTFVISAAACYCRNTTGYLICILIALLYNIIMNRKLPKMFLGLINSRWKKGKNND